MSAPEPIPKPGPASGPAQPVSEAFVDEIRQRIASLGELDTPAAADEIESLAVLLEARLNQ